MKRLFDITVALAGLIICAPLLATIALAVFVTMGRPILFRQLRGGKGGAVFEILKFRTMCPGEESDAIRVTPLGRVLRRSSLDELPELWNVLRGEMSVVGPRPLLAEYLPGYTAFQLRRHGVRPGITGLAQVEGRNALGWDARFERDLYYVDHHSFRLDLEILRRTVLVVLSQRGSTGDDQSPFDSPRSTEALCPQPMDGYAKSADGSTGTAQP